MPQFIERTVDVERYDPEIGEWVRGWVTAEFSVYIDHGDLMIESTDDILYDPKIHNVDDSYLLEDELDNLIDSIRAEGCWR